jgi:hypothetical protein
VPNWLTAAPFGSVATTEFFENSVFSIVAGVAEATSRPPPFAVSLTRRRR